MAVDMFLDIDDALKGEAQDAKYKHWIDVLAWSWGMSQSGSFHVGGGGGAGKANFEDLTITKYIDKSSPDLMTHCANGEHFKQAKLVMRKAGKKPLEYLIIEMKKVLVTSVSPGGLGGVGGDDRLTETTTLNFAQVKVKYKEQKPDGSAGPEKMFTWDIARNTDN